MYLIYCYKRSCQFSIQLFGIRFDTVAVVNIYRKVVVRISQFINCRLGRYITPQRVTNNDNFQLLLIHRTG